MIRKERHIVLDWADIKRKFLDVVAEGKPWGPGPNARHSHAHRMVSASRNLFPPTKPSNCPTGLGHRKHYCDYCQWQEQFGKKSWEGGSWGDSVRYLREGFFADEFAHSAEYVALAPKKRPQWSEEPDGDLDMGRLYGGYDTPYMVPAEAEKKPGIRVLIEFAFACGVKAETIQKYGAWVAGLLGSLESSGYDMTVDLWIPLDNLFVDSEYGRRDNVLIRVKRENEVSDFTEWSGIFSPAGYRHIGFCGKLVAGDKVGSLCSTGLGYTHPGGWDLEYDKDNSILKIHCDQQGHGLYGGNAFPTERLNKKAVEIGLLPEQVGHGEMRT
jgi:hypothetical protein